MVARELDPLELLNERISGLWLAYEEGFDKEKDGLSIVEDYVRSLGGPDSAGEYFQTADGGGAATAGTAGTSSTISRFSVPFMIARRNQPGNHAPGTPAFSDLPPSIKTGGPQDWVEFGAALEDSFEDAAWFRMSLNLLAEICKDRNAYTQRIVGSILPAECLLSVLEVRNVLFPSTNVF